MEEEEDDEDEKAEEEDDDEEEEEVVRSMVDSTSTPYLDGSEGEAEEAEEEEDEAGADTDTDGGRATKPVVTCRARPATAMPRRVSRTFISELVSWPE